MALFLMFPLPFVYNPTVARRFTLLDDEYFDALLRVCQVLNREAFPFALVGGGAVQAWVAALHTGEGSRRLSEEPILETALRKTRDLDFATRAEPGTMTAVLNGLASDFGDGRDP